MKLRQTLMIALCGGLMLTADYAEAGNKKIKKRKRRAEVAVIVKKVDKITVEKKVVKTDGNWHSYLGNESRSAISTKGIVTKATPSWTFSMLPPVPGFKPKFHNEQGEKALGQQSGIPHYASRFDFASPVVIDNNKVYFGTSTEESLYCLDIKQGKILWIHRTEGSIRLSPKIVKDKIYFGSDDGHLYCLDKNSGKEIWKFAAGKTNRHIIANNRFASQYPLRTSITFYKGMLHFAAGAFPNGGGVFLYGLDVATGKENWKTELFTSAPGYILAKNGKLYVPTGRAAPTEYDAETGESITLKKIVSRMDGGGSDFVGELYDMIVFGPNEKGALTIRVDEEASKQKFFDGRAIKNIIGNLTMLDGTRLIADEKQFYLLNSGTITAMPNGSLIESLKQSAAEFNQRRGNKAHSLIGGKGMYKGDKAIAQQIEGYKTWTAKTPDAVSMIVAGDKIYAGAKDKVYVVNMQDGSVTNIEIDGIAWEIAAGGNSLFVSTDAGKIYCFGADSANAQIATQTKKAIAVSADMKKYAEDAVSFTDVDKGFCVILGATDGSLGYALSSLNEMQIVYFVKTEEIAKKIIGKYINTGLYGKKVTVRVIEEEEIPYIKYFANLIVSEKGVTEDIPFKSSEVFKILQPNGGALVLSGKSANYADSWKSSIPTIKRNANYAVAIRGDLEKAGNWTHMWADPQNTSTSGDDLVKGEKYDTQWFGFPYPSGQSTGWHFLSISSLYNKGILLCLYTESMIAVDAWNGTVLWKKDISGSIRLSPMREGGSSCMDDNYYYLTFDAECHVIDLKDGKTVKKLKLPNSGDWGYIASYKNYLFGTSQNSKATNKSDGSRSPKGFWHGAEGTFVTSEYLTMKKKGDFNDVWSYNKAGHSIVNSTITIGDDEIFFVETKLPTGSHTLSEIKNSEAKIVAIKLSDKSKIWEKDLTIKMRSILYMAYKNKHIYISASSSSGQKKRKVGYHYQKIDASNGEMVWSKENLALGNGPTHNENVVNSVYLDDYIWCIPPSSKSFKISTKDGTSTELKRARGRGKGCSMVTASNHMAIYRSNGIGATFFDEETGGFVSQVSRPSCLIGIIPAGGLVLMPEGSLGCVCGFPYQGTTVLAPKE